MMKIIKPPRWKLINHSHPLARELAGCWLFNEGTGDKIYDLSSYRNYGTLANMSVPDCWVAGRDGEALEFSGNNTYISIPDHSSLDFGTSIDYTFLVWVKNSSDPGDDYPYYIQRRDTDGTPSYGFGIFNDGGANDKKINFADGTASIISTDIYNDDQWHQFIGIADRDTDSYLFIDGAQVNNSGASSDSVSLSLGTPWYIGAGLNSEGVPHYYFVGVISYVAIWKRALSAEEITWLYSEPYAMFD